MRRSPRSAITHQRLPRAAALVARTLVLMILASPLLAQDAAAIASAVSPAPGYEGKQDLTRATPADAGTQDQAREALTVADAVEAALANQPRLKAAQTRSDAAAARTTAAGLDRFGRIGANALYTPWQKPLTVDFPGAPPYVPPSSFEVRQLATFALNASATVPLYTWGALSNQRAAARTEEAATREDTRRAKQQTEFEARRAFYGAVAAEAAVGVFEKSLAQQKAFLETAMSRERAGAVAHLDVLKAELGVRRAEATLGETKNAARLAREALVTVTVDARFRGASLLYEGPPATPLPEEAQALGLARASRPDLAALGRQAESIRLAAKALDASALPSLAVRAEITQQDDDASGVLDARSRLYQVGFVVGWDAVGSKRSRVRAQELRANERGVRELARGTGESVDLEVRSALLSAREARDRFDTEKRALTVAEEQARVARLAYREGLTTAVEAQDAELALTSTEFAVLRAALDLATAHAELRLAMGE